MRSHQTETFECVLDDATLAAGAPAASIGRIGDRIAHAEELRIVSGELYCDACKAFTTRYYLAVYRGVLVGIETEREAAEALLRSFSFEKLLLWYHDLYRKRRRALADNRRAEAFMRNVCKWFEGGYDKLAPEDEPKRRWLFVWDRNVLEKSDTPLAALQYFLAQREAEAKAGDDNGQMSLW